jgi:nucleoside-diphosphate-sugar epimerase
MKTALVLGAGGFIGSHLVKKLKSEGYWVRGVDLKFPDFSKTAADDFLLYDLRVSGNVEAAMRLELYNGDPLPCKFLKYPFSELSTFDEVYQLAADMGGAGYIFSGENDSDVMHNSASINLNVVEWAKHYKVEKVFYSSSACMYPAYNQEDPENPNCKEESAYPANPDSEYGWEKLFSERLYLAYARNHGLNVRIARFHNIFGPEGTWKGGKEKAPAALCRKVAEAKPGTEIEIWGDGKQTRSFLYIDECIEGVRSMMKSDFQGPVNIGSEEMITINGLAKMVIDFDSKDLEINNIPGPVGVRGRNSDNHLCREKLSWEPKQPLVEGMKKTYQWIKAQLEKS